MKTRKIKRLLIALTASLGLFTWESASNKPLSQTAYAVSDKSLKNLKYHGREIITVDGDHPLFRVEVNPESTELGKNTAIWII